MPVADAAAAPSSCAEDTGAKTGGHCRSKTACAWQQAVQRPPARLCLDVAVVPGGGHTRTQNATHHRRRRPHYVRASPKGPGLSHRPALSRPLSWRLVYTAPPLWEWRLAACRTSLYCIPDSKARARSGAAHAAGRAPCSGQHTIPTPRLSLAAAAAVGQGPAGALCLWRESGERQHSTA